MHKLAGLTYPIILISGVIVGASYWGLETFPYISGPNVLYSMIPNLILSIAVGITLHLLFNFSKPKREEPHAIWFDLIYIYIQFKTLKLDYLIDLLSHYLINLMIRVAW